MQQTFFSIIVVSLNPGAGLKKTLDSIKNQTFSDYEVVIKDGGSKDGALETLEETGYFSAFERIRMIRRMDSSIYDGMNQALPETVGKYIQFLNCGDSFYNEQVLAGVADFIKQKENISCETGKAEHFYIYYGNQYNQQQQCVITSAPEINDFTCYRNVPCHQVCFYHRSLFMERGYLLRYTVRADYEHFLYCIYEKKAAAVSMPLIICFYEGGGYSETKENRRLSNLQHKEITRKYLGKKAYRYQLIMLFTLAPLRTKLAESKHFSTVYNRVKSLLYRS